MNIEIVCHRGANHVAPENTLAAAEICYRNGYDYVELDLQTSADGRLVVLHDATLDRTTNGSGAVAEATWAELAGLDAGSWFDPRFADQRIPLLDDMLQLAASLGGKLYIELKAADPGAMLKAISSAGMMSNCFFGSEYPQTMREVRALAPDATLMARRCDFATFRETVEDCNSQIIEFDQTIDDLSELALCREFGVRSMIYDQTHNIADMERLADIGPDLVNVDRPDLFKPIRDRRGGSP